MTPHLSILTKNALQYHKWEAKVYLKASYTNPYDYKQIRIEATFTHTTGICYCIDGFFMQPYEIKDALKGQISPTDKGSFYIRFAPPLDGQWSVHTRIITAEDSTAIPPIAIHVEVATPSNNQGYIQTSNTNYLAFGTEQTFIPIGCNMAWPAQNTIQDYQSWLTQLADNGGNFFRLWQCHWGLGLEWTRDSYEGLLKYQQANAFLTDWLFDYAQEKGIYILYALQHHGQVSSKVNSNWKENPYNRINGGPCRNTWDFFTNELAIEMTKNRFRYVVARWGYTQSIMAWELFNEVDWTDQFETYQSAIANWQLDMANFLKTIDPYQHLVTTSYAREQYDPTIWEHPIIDFTQTHHYSDTTNLEYGLRFKTISYLKAYTKPTINSEFSVSSNGDSLSSKDPSGVHLHNALWGSFFGGAMGSGMSWWWDNYLAPNQLFYHFNALSKYLDTVNWLKGDFRPTKGLVSGTYSDLLITPRKGWGAQTDSLIQISRSGKLSNEIEGLSHYLYGKGWNTAFRNPPTFVVELNIAQQFSVQTGAKASKKPMLSITLNDKQVLCKAAKVNTKYTIQVPAGKHSIRVENVGLDWISISNYSISGIGEGLDNYILKSEKQAEIHGWLLNNQYNHQTIERGASVPPITGASLSLMDIQEGNYQITFHDCHAGHLVDQIKIPSSGSILTFDLPSIEWDICFKAQLKKDSDTLSDPLIA